MAYLSIDDTTPPPLQANREDFTLRDDEDSGLGFRVPRYGLLRHMIAQSVAARVHEALRPGMRPE